MADSQERGKELGKSKSFLWILGGVAATLILVFWILVSILAWLGGAFAGGLQGFVNMPFGPIVRIVKELFAIGFLSMTLLQSLRMILPLRGWFHRSQVRGWLGSPAMEELIKLSQSTSNISFFDLPISQLCGQIGQISETALASAEKNLELLKKLSGDDGLTVEMWDSLKRARKTDSTSQQDKTAEEKAAEAKRAARAARTELNRLNDGVAGQMRRSIDGFQIATANHWHRLLRASAVILSAGQGWVLATAVRTGGPGEHTVPTYIAASVIAGLAGGFIATILRDLIAIIERLRG